MRCTGATGARIAMTSWVLLNASTPADVEVRYRLNGGAEHTYKYTPSQLALIEALPVFGTIGLVLDVDPVELRDGTNTIELAARNVSFSYPPVVYNLDLVVDAP